MIVIQLTSPDKMRIKIFRNGKVEVLIKLISYDLNQLKEVV